MPLGNVRKAASLRGDARLLCSSNGEECQIDMLSSGSRPVVRLGCRMEDDDDHANVTTLAMLDATWAGGLVRKGTRREAQRKRRTSPTNNLAESCWRKISSEASRPTRGSFQTLIVPSEPSNRSRKALISAESDLLA